MRSLRDRLRGSESSADADPIAHDAESMWNALYTLGVGAVGVVDDRGAVYPDRRRLSVEVWFGVGDRWLRGGSGDGVRQRRSDGLPIIETRQRVGESDVVQTAWADESGDGKGRINVHLANETDDAVIAAVVVRPFGAIEPGTIDSIRCVDSLIVTNGRPVVDIGRVPGDCATAQDISREAPAVLDAVSVATGDQADSWEMSDPNGAASLAAMIPLTPGVDRTLQILDGREEATVAPAPLDAVVRGWKHHLSDAAEIELPRWPAHLFTSLSSSLLGAAAQTGRPLGDRTWSLTDDAIVVSALGAIGLGASGAPITADLLGGVVSSNVGREHWVDVAAAIAGITGTPEGEAVLVHEREAVAAVVGHVLSTSYNGAIAVPLVEAIAISNGPEAASDAAQIVGKAPRGDGARALLRHGWIDSGTASAEDFARGDRPKTAEAIAIEMIASASRGEPSEPLVALRSQAGSSWRWARDGCGDSPHARAQLALALVAWCRTQRVDNGVLTIDLLPGMRPEWYGQSLSFSRLPVAGARLSCALRWHGARPALLWEFEGEVPAGCRLTCARLDTDFETDDSSGEVLLSVPPGGPE